MALPRRALGPVTAATDFSNVNHNCDPPATLTSLSTALVQGNCYGSTDVLKGSNWVGIDPTGLCSDNANEPPPDKYYIYDTEFTLPACAANLSISGSMMADNAAAAYLNVNQIGFQSNASGGTSANFTLPGTSFGSKNQSYFQLGTTNVLDFLVQDTSGSDTALDFTATVTYSPCGMLKICKIAGFGVPVGQHFTFAMSPAPLSGPSTASVPAGPVPGGYCVLAGNFAANTAVTVTETIPPGDSISGIRINPTQPGDSVSPGTGTAVAVAGLGLTEVTYANVSRGAEDRSGFMEICKQAVTSPPWAGGGAANPVFQFTVQPQTAGGVSVPGQTVSVPAGTCSAPIQVLVGSVQVNESSVPFWNMVHCGVTNGGTLGLCNLTGKYAQVNVPSGGVANEAILTITNSRWRPVPICDNCLVPVEASIGAGNSDIATGTVTGNAQHGHPTGTMTFYECGPTARPRACTSKADPVGNPVGLTQGTGNTATGTSAPFWPNATGYWCFAEYYSGNESNRASSDTSTDGCFDVT